MNIHYLSISTLISDQANSVHVMRMSAALARQGHAVTLHAFRGPGSDDDVFAHYGVGPNFALERHPARNERWGSMLADIARSRMPGKIRGLAKILLDRTTVRHALRHRNVDLAYARNVVSLAVMPRDLPFVFEAHSPPAQSLIRFIERRAFRRASLRQIVVISKPLRDRFVATYPWLADKVLVAHDGADDPFAPNATGQAAPPAPAETPPVGTAGRSTTPAVPARPEAGDPPTAHDESSAVADTGNPALRPFTVGYVGHLYPGRGGDMIAAIAAQLPEVRFELVGGRPEDVEALQERVTSDNVVTHGHVAPTELPTFFPRFDAVVAPYQRSVSISGGNRDTSAYMSPLKIFEYMSWAKPLVASDLPVLHEVLRHDGNALLVEPDNVAAWVDAISALQSSPALRERLGATARADFLARYTWDARAAAILERVTDASRQT